MRRVAALMALLLGAIGVGRAQTQACPKHLFIIARNKNANIVAYDAHPGKAGELVSSQPVVAYWLLDGDESRREELTRFQRNRAYGVEGTPAATPATYLVDLKAQPKRRLVVRMLDGCWVATTEIGGKDAILRRMFVQAKEGTALPKVEYVEFFGEDPGSREPLYEKFVP